MIKVISRLYSILVALPVASISGIRSTHFFICFTISWMESPFSPNPPFLSLPFLVFPPKPHPKQSASISQMDGFLCLYEWIYLPLLEPLVNNLSLHLCPDRAPHTTPPLLLLKERLALAPARTGNCHLVQTIERQTAS